jgi:hypothetical protein
VFRRFVMRRGPGLLGRAVLNNAPRDSRSQLLTQPSTSGPLTHDDQIAQAQDPRVTRSRRYRVDQEALLAGPDADLSA